MLYLRGHSLEYDRWAQLGCHGWERGPILPSCRLLSLGLLAFVATSTIALARTAPSQPSSPEMREMMQKHHRLGMMPMTGQPGMRAGANTPTMPGEDAFGAIQEIVRILDADPNTDWSKVDLEVLRQHLIDMNEVTLRAEGTCPLPVASNFAILEA
jgi:hypothetical protein